MITEAEQRLAISAPSCRMPWVTYTRRKLLPRRQLNSPILPSRTPQVLGQPSAPEGTVETRSKVESPPTCKLTAEEAAAEAQAQVNTLSAALAADQAASCIGSCKRSCITARDDRGG
ncbi:hypothetical protein JTB14_021436 [Gonioctena quinquepunctata]|nr:hypothetical protein JTB14_021436 [Gonioctena quinquepunctata]